MFVVDVGQAWIERVAEIPVDGSNLRPDVCLIEVGLGSEQARRWLMAYHIIFSCYQIR